MPRQPAHYRWALLLARIYAAFPLLCPRGGGEMRIIAFITAALIVQKILTQVGEPTSAPPLAKARRPPLWEMQDAATGETDSQVQPEPDYQFDQRAAWSVRKQGESLLVVRRLVPTVPIPAHGGQFGGFRPGANCNSDAIQRQSTQNFTHKTSIDRCPSGARY